MPNHQDTFSALLKAMSDFDQHLPGSREALTAAKAAHAEACGELAPTITVTPAAPEPPDLNLSELAAFVVNWVDSRNGEGSAARRAVALRAWLLLTGLPIADALTYARALVARREYADVRAAVVPF